VALAVAVYRDAYAAEAGRYAGAEPGLAGLLMAAPFVAVVVAQAACALAVSISTASQTRTAWTVAGLTTTVVCPLGTLAVIAF
jgi:hypothetical protein